jgi:hypothetical protein
MTIAQNHLVMPRTSDNALQGLAAMDKGAMIAKTSSGAVKERSVKPLILIVGTIITIVAVAIVVVVLAKSLLVGLLVAGVGLMSTGLSVAYRNWSERKGEQVFLRGKSQELVNKERQKFVNEDRLAWQRKQEINDASPKERRVWLREQKINKARRIEPTGIKSEDIQSKGIKCVDRHFRPSQLLPKSLRSPLQK